MALTGLSPQAQGKPEQDLIAIKSLGPIPASAGETSSLIAGTPVVKVYPRKRGGNGDVVGRWTAPKGLSPQARGKRYRDTLNVACVGPIPASAGETT